jgi:hypothetical protein
MNTFRTITQTFLMAVLFVGSVSASEACQTKSIPSFKTAFVNNIHNAYKHNPVLFPLAGAFVAVNCGDNTTSNKIASTLVKTVFLGVPRVSSNKEELVAGANIKAMGQFAATDAFLSFVTAQIAAIKQVKSVLDSVEGAVGKKAMKVMRMGKELAVGYAAYRLVNRFSLRGAGPQNPLYGEDAGSSSNYALF